MPQKKFANTLTDIYLVVIRYLGSVYVQYLLAFAAGSLFVDSVPAQRVRDHMGFSPMMVGIAFISAAALIAAWRGVLLLRMSRFDVDLMARRWFDMKAGKGGTGEQIGEEFAATLKLLEERRDRMVNGAIRIAGFVVSTGFFGGYALGIERYGWMISGAMTLFCLFYLTNAFRITIVRLKRQM
jgi:hypothetical protein